jgi:L,D-transpeptidase YcbB
MRPGGATECRAAGRRNACVLAFAVAAIVTNVDGASARSFTTTPRRDAGVVQQTISSTQAALRDMFRAAAADSPVGAFPPSIRRQLSTFYERRSFRSVWTGGLLELQRAHSALSVLEKAEEQGLRSEDYAAPKVQMDKGPKPGQEAAEYDLLLTEALLRYSRDVAIGRTRPPDVYSDVQLPAPEFDAVALLTQMLTRGSIAGALAELPPPHPQYRLLVQALARYRAIAAEGGWPSIPGRDGPDVVPNSKRVELLIERLALEDPQLAEVESLSPDDLRQALMRFQSRNGLAADGRLTASTVAALNVPVEKRIAQIAANMERWRWLPRTFEDRYIAINVPDQSLEYVHAGTTELSSRVIVGRTNSTTPILRTTITGIIANPQWEIPGVIVVNQLLPKLRNNPGYLAAGNMVLANGPESDPHGLKVNWRNITAAEFPYRVVQTPGPNNALGFLMLDSPNDFDVYLHDTPAKVLFTSNVRTVSNGCVRVEAIRPLAALALDDGSQDAEEQIAAAIESRDTQRLPLDRPLPVYFLYWTAIAADDATVGFRRDFYARDEPLTAAMASPRGEEPELVSAVTPDDVTPPIQSARVSNTLLPAAGRNQNLADPEQVELAKEIAEAEALAERETTIEPTRLSGRNVSNVSLQTRSASSPPAMEPLFPRLRAWLDGRQPPRKRYARP